MRWELIPVVFGLFVFVVGSKYKTEVLNLLPISESSWYNLLSQKKENQIGRKLSGLLRYQFCLSGGLDKEQIDFQIVKEVYRFVLQAMEESGFLTVQDVQLIRGGEGGKDVTIDDGLINIFYSDSKYCSGKNYYELFVLPCGYLYISEPLIEQVLTNGENGLTQLIFLIIRELAHLKKRHIMKNILSQHRYGDIKKQLFLFETGYTGFDALFIDYYTNQRMKVEQELHADIFACNVMHKSLGIPFSIDDYRAALKIIQDEPMVKQDLKTPQIKFEKEFRERILAQSS